jgi:hypothetical protein
MANYKESLIQELEKEVVATRKAIETFFDESKKIDTRLKAFQICGTFTESLDIERALAIYKNPDTNEHIKASAIIGLVSYAAENESFIDELINLISKTQESDEIQKAALYVLQTNTFSSTYMSSKRPDYTNALRNLSNVGGESTKSTAIEYLALEKDEYIQRKLVEGLEDPNKEIIKPEVAIQLLSYDLHAENYPLFRKIAENPPNKRSKKEALRNLSSDPNSADLLLKTLNDKSEDDEIRHVCAVGLQAMESNALQSSMKTILTDADEDSEFKTAMANTLNYLPDSKDLDNDQTFQADLKTIQKSSRSKEMKGAFKKYQINKEIKE